MAYGAARWGMAVVLGALWACAPAEAPPAGPAPEASVPARPEARPWAASRRYETPCSRSAFAPEGPLRERDTWGADGVLREHLVTSPGWGSERTVQTVEQGRVRARDVLRNEALVRHEAWDYGARGEVLEHVTQEGPRATRTRYRYDGEGRVEREEHFSAEALRAVTRYTYGPPGLLSVEYVDDWDVDPRVVWSEHFTYAPDGVLAHYERREGGLSHRVDYDAHGRAVVDEASNTDPTVGGEFSTRTESSYDAQGRLTLRTTRAGTLGGRSEREEAFTYDAAGRLTRVRDERRGAGSDGVLGPATVSTRTLAYDARGDLVGEATDLDGDGLPDRARALTRDAFGNLLEERLNGALEPSDPGLVAYTYECHVD